MTSYDEIYERFTGKITDFKMMELNDSDIRELLNGYLKSSIAKFKKCENDISDYDDETETFNVDLLDIEKEILAIMMVVEWLEPQVNSVLYTSQFFGNKEQKFFSPANQIQALISLKRSSELKAQKLIRNYLYQKSITSTE